MEILGIGNNSPGGSVVLYKQLAGIVVVYLLVDYCCYYCCVCVQGFPQFRGSPKQFQIVSSNCFS